MEVIVQPLPRKHLGNLQPRLTISQWAEEPETPDKCCNDHATGSPSADQCLTSNALADRFAALSCLCLATLLAVHDRVARTNGLDFLWLNVEDELNNGTCDKTRCQMSWKVVVEEELATHDEERKIVGSPYEEEETCAVIQS